MRQRAVPEEEALRAAGQLGDRPQIEAELDAVLAETRRFWSLQPDQVMQMCAAFTARLTELEVLLHRAETRDRQYKQIRTLQVHKILDECERQFKIASRLVEVRRQDIEGLRGMA